MPRASIRPDEASSGGQFSFPEGNGEIVAARIVNHTIPGYATDCCYGLTIRPLNKDWNPTGSEDIEEMIKAGPVSAGDGTPLFHPGNAVSADDQDPELEIGGRKDMGDADGAEGTCLLTASRMPDKKSKIMIFSRSLEEHGVKSSLLDGYAPNLIGLRAHFTQLPMEKMANSTAKNDPMCLIIGTNGKSDPSAKVAQYPYAMTGGKAAPTALSGAGKAPAKPAASKANGAPAAMTEMTTAAPAPASTPSAAQSSEEIESLALQLMILEGTTNAGKTTDKIRLNAKLTPLMARGIPLDDGTKQKIPMNQHKPIQQLWKNPEWFNEKAEMLGWTVTGDQITFPAAEA